MRNIKTSEEQRGLCEAWRQSGLSKPDFCLMNNLSLSSFYSWLKKLRGQYDKPANKDGDLKNKSPNKNDAIKFLKISTSLSPSPSISGEPCYLEITLPNGVNFKVKLPPNNMDKFLEGLLTWK